MTTENKLKIASVAAAGALFVVLGFDNNLTTAEYTVRSAKIKKPVSLVFLSDIHSQRYRDGGKELLSMIDSANPDFVFLGGDIFDKYALEKDIERTAKFVDEICENYDCSYVLGNHEIESKRGIDYKKRLKEKNLRFFDGKSVELVSKSDQHILLGGVDYVECPNPPAEAAVAEAKQELIDRAEETGLFSVLLRHVPMRTEGDEKIDLVLSGHNHGGLWRFPKTNAGIAGGGKTILPEFAHGEYKKDGSTMIVGSGITTHTYLLPRIYNAPEVVKVTLLPEIISKYR